MALVAAAVHGLVLPPRLALPLTKSVADATFHAHAIAWASRIVVADPALLAQTVAASRRPRAPHESAPRCSAADAGIQRTITFTGCGGLYVYLFGVAAYIQQNFEWDADAIAVASASAGAYPAYLLNAGIDIESFHHAENRQFLATVNAASRDGRRAALGRWNEVLALKWREAVTGRLAVHEMERLLHRRHFVSLTVLPTLENALVGEFDSTDDLFEGFIASGYLPLYDRHGRLGGLQALDPSTSGWPSRCLLAAR
jgi:hypothetical protein